MNGRLLFIAIAAMVAGGLVWTAYVLFSAASNSSSAVTGLAHHARGELSRLVVLSDPPAQPDTVFRTEAGEDITLESFRGKVVMVNIWATWCAPCVKEMPSLNRLEAELGSDQFEVVAITLDRNVEDARAFYDEHELGHLKLYQERTLAIGGALGARGVPITVLYGVAGNELARVANGAEWDSPEALALVREVIASEFARGEPGS